MSWINSSPPGQSTPITVGQGPSAIAYGEGSAWVVNATDGTLQRIDANLEAVGSDRDRWCASGGGARRRLGVGDRHQFQFGSQGRPRKPQVVARVSVGNNPVAVAFGGGRVWVANAADGTVTSIDPATDQGRQILVGGNPDGVAYANGAVWVAVGQPASLVRIDARSLHVDSTTATDSVPQAGPHRPTGHG